MKIDASLINEAGDLLQLAIMSCNLPPKAVAASIGYSVDSLYSACNGSRNFPIKAQQCLSRLNIFGAMAVAWKATGLPKLFGYLKIDGHPQSITCHLKNNLKIATELTDKIPYLILEKSSREDLTDEEYQELRDINCKLIDLSNFIYNYAGRMDEKYSLDLMVYVQEKESPPAVTSRRAM